MRYELDADGSSLVPILVSPLLTREAKLVCVTLNLRCQALIPRHKPASFLVNEDQPVLVIRAESHIPLHDHTPAHLALR
jgi:hypothetical protein